VSNCAVWLTGNGQSVLPGPQGNNQGQGREFIWFRSIFEPQQCTQVCKSWAEWSSIGWILILVHHNCSLFCYGKNSYFVGLTFLTISLHILSELLKAKYDRISRILITAMLFLILLFLTQF